MPEEEPKKPGGSKISNFEWWLVVGATFCIDLIQIILDFFAVGVIVNRLIDIAVGMTLGFYFWIRGVKMDSKKIFAWIGTFVGEEIPGIDALPFWTGDVLLTMAWDKAD